MKKIITSSGLCFLFLYSLSCFSGNNIKENRKYAVVMISSNHHISYYDSTGKDKEENAIGTYKTPGKTTGGETLEEKTEYDRINFGQNTEEIAVKFADELEKKIRDEGINILPFTDVVNDEFYSSIAVKAGSDKQNTYYPVGFGAVPYANRQIMEKLCNKLRIDGYIIVRIFLLKEETGEIFKTPREVIPAAKVELDIFDKSGKILHGKERTIRSERVILVDGEKTNDALMEKEIRKCLTDALREVLK